MKPAIVAHKRHLDQSKMRHERYGLQGQNPRYIRRLTKVKSGHPPESADLPARPFAYPPNPPIAYASLRRSTSSSSAKAEGAFGHPPTLRRSVRPNMGERFTSPLPLSASGSDPTCRKIHEKTRVICEIQRFTRPGRGGLRGRLNSTPKPDGG